MFIKINGMWLKIIDIVDQGWQQGNIYILSDGSRYHQDQIKNSDIKFK